MIEGRDDFVGVGRLGQVLCRTQFDRLDRGGDAGIAGQHHDARVWVEVVQHLDQSQSGRPAHFKIDHGELWRIAFSYRDRLFHAVCHRYGKAASFQGGT